MDGCANSPKKIFNNKNWTAYSLVYSISTIWGFNHIKNKHILYCGKDCMKKFFTSLRAHAKNIVDFEKKKKKVKEESKPYKDAKMLYLL